jgi:hypothetical protein
MVCHRRMAVASDKFHVTALKWHNVRSSENDIDPNKIFMDLQCTFTAAIYGNSDRTSIYELHFQSDASDKS